MKNRTKLISLIFTVTVLAALLSIAVIGLSACKDNTDKSNLTVTYDDTHVVYVGDGLESLKPYLTVTYTDKDGDVSAVEDYALSGTLEKGECTVTVQYLDLTASCKVTVDAATLGLQYTLNDDDETYSVTGIGTATDTDLIIPSTYFGSSVTMIGSYAFDNCRSLTSVTIPDSVTSIDDGAFRGCSSLTSVTIPDSVTSIGNLAFRGCSSLANINYLGTVESWCNMQGLSNLMNNYSYGIDISSKTFSLNGKPVMEIVIPDAITDIPSYAFHNCTNITSVTIPDSVTSIGGYAFSGCTNIKNAVMPTLAITYIPKTNLQTVVITSGDSIGEEAFRSGGSMTSITIPDSVTNIRYSAFLDCGSLTIYCEATSKPSDWSTDWNRNDRNFLLFCPIVWDCNNNDKDENGYAYIVVDGIRYSLKDNIASLVRQPGNLAEANIPQNITYKNSEYGVTSIGNSAFWRCSSLTSVTIPDTVTSIGYNAFYNCSSLTSITISDSVTSIGGDAFENCNNLQYNEYGNAYYLGNDGNPYLVLVKAKDTSITSCTVNENTKVIADSAFYNCSSLTSVTIPDSVTSISKYAFYNCSSLTSVTIPDTVTSIGYNAFYNCSSLTSITIPDSVTSIGHNAFENCNNLQYNEYGNAYYLGNDGNPYLVLVKAKDTSITSCTINEKTKFIYEMAFYHCSSLTSVTIPDTVTSIGNSAFGICRSLANINYLGTVESWCNIQGLGSLMDYGTYKTFSLNGARVTELVIPNTVTSIPSYAFKSTKINSVTFEENSQCTRIGYSAFQWSTLFNIVIPNSVISISDYAFSGSYIRSVTIPDSVTNIGEGVFYHCSSLTSITIPDSVTSIGGDSYSNGAFSDCSELASINYLGTIESWCNIQGLYNLMKYGSSKTFSLNGEPVTELVLPDTVTSIPSYAFNAFTNITSVTIPDSVTSIGGDAFGRCYKLIEVCNLSNLGIVAGSEDNGRISYYAKNVYVPTSGESKLTTTSDGYIFYDDSEAYLVGYVGNSTELILPSTFNGKSYTIYQYAFSGCSSLIRVSISNGVTNIGDNAFYNCSSLTSVTIPDTVTSISNYTFYGCSSLTSITISDSVTSIGYNAFSNCSKIKTINFTGTKAQWNNITKDVDWKHRVPATKVICRDGEIAL